MIPSMLHCLGCGALNLDLVYEVESLEEIRVPGLELHPGGEVSGTRREAEAILDRLKSVGFLRAESGGGSAANTIFALSRLGWRTAFCGVVGEDATGDFILRSMGEVDCTLVRRGGLSALCLVVLDARRRDRALFVVPHDPKLDLSGTDVLKRLLKVRVLHMSSLIHAQGLLSQQRLADALTPKQILSLDPGEIYARRGLEGIASLLRRTDLLFITEEEVRMLTGETWERGVERLRDLMDEAAKTRPLPGGCLFSEAAGRVVICKRGALGASVHSARLTLDLPVKPVTEVVDNTGAGDAFNAGFLHSVLEGQGAQEALRSGVKLAARSLSGFGRDWI